MLAVSPYPMRHRGGGAPGWQGLEPLPIYDSRMAGRFCPGIALGRARGVRPLALSAPCWVTPWSTRRARVPPWRRRRLNGTREVRETSAWAEERSTGRDGHRSPAGLQSCTTSSPVTLSLHQACLFKLVSPWWPQAINGHDFRYKCPLESLGHQWMISLRLTTSPR